MPDADLAAAPASLFGDEAARPAPTLRGWSIGLVVASTVADLAWVLRDHTSPSWDQSHYLFLTWTYQQALDHHGPLALLRAVYGTDPSRAPLLSVLLLPLAYVLGPGPGMGLALNLLAWPVLLWCTGSVAERCFGGRARFFAILFLIPMPEVVALSHTVLQDFLLVTLTVVAVRQLLAVDLFRRTGASVALGAVLALGSLCKFSFLVGVAAPLVTTVAVAGVDMAAGRRNGQPVAVPLRNLALALGLAVSPFVLWYGPNWSATAAYLHVQYSAQAGSVPSPLAPAHVLRFLVATADDMSWLAVVIAGAALVLTLATSRRAPPAPGPHRRSAVRAVFLGGWFLVPLVVTAANVNQDSRYVIAAYPALAVIVGGLASRLRHPAAVALGAVMAASCLLQGALVEVAGFRTPLLPASLSWSTPFGLVALPLAGGDGPAGPPASRDVTMAVLRVLEAEAPGGRHRPAVVDLAELEALANGNDLGYDAAVRGDAFTFVTLDGPLSRAQLRADLGGATFLLYAHQPPLARSTSLGRVGQLNASAAARQITPAMLGLFSSRPRLVEVGGNAGQGADLAVFVRRSPGAPAGPGH